MSTSPSCYPTSPSLLFFFFNATATTDIYTLSLHDALPILQGLMSLLEGHGDITMDRAAADRIPSADRFARVLRQRRQETDRKSTRLNSSHANISYAVFCLKKKKKKK